MEEERTVLVSLRQFVDSHSVKSLPCVAWPLWSPSQMSDVQVAVVRSKEDMRDTHVLQKNVSHSSHSAHRVATAARSARVPSSQPEFPDQYVRVTSPDYALPPESQKLELNMHSPRHLSWLQVRTSMMWEGTTAEASCG